MSLKSLVQLFAEKFLQSKKGWVADQSTISLQDSTQLSVITDGKSHPFTMPYTGVVNLRGYGVWFTDIGGFNLINLGPSANGNLSIWVYAKKVKNSPTQLGNQTSSLLPIFVYTKSKVTIDLMFGGASC